MQAYELKNIFFFFNFQSDIYVDKLNNSNYTVVLVFLFFGLHNVESLLRIVKFCRNWLTELAIETDCELIRLTLLFLIPAMTCKDKGQVILLP